MNQGTGFLLVVLGLLLMYVVITGKFAIIENAFYQLFNIQAESKPGNKATSQRVTAPSIDIPQMSGDISLPQIFVPDYT